MADAKCRKACSRYQALGNVQLVPSAGKYVVGAKRGKTCGRCQKLLGQVTGVRTEKNAIKAKREKVHAS